MEDVLTGDWFVVTVMLAALGAVSGLLAGLLGIGGGAVMVPGLFHIFQMQHAVSGNIMHMAIGTSLATIVPTGISSALAHHRKRAVDFDIVRRLGFGVVAGTLSGTIIAGQISGAALGIIFAVAIAFLAVIMAANPSRFQIRGDLPGQPGASLAGFFIGNVSAMIGIGGATMSVPFMSVCGVPIHRALGTASAIGLLISIPAALGFMMTGRDETGLPPFSAGYVNFPALAVMACASVPCAPVGAALAHKIPVRAMRMVFAVFLALLACKMAADLS